MALTYDAFGVRHFEFVANLWPDLDALSAPELRRLFGELTIGPDDEFTSCDLRPGMMGARFTGEHWTYDIASSSILLRCNGYSSSENLRATVRGLLGQTRRFFVAKHQLAFYVEAIRVYGVVPDDKDRDVGEVAMKRLLRNVSRDDLEILPGLTAAGLQLVGDTDEFHWHARIEAPHGNYESLGLSAELMFYLSPDPPTDADDLDTIDAQVETTHSFITTLLPVFASKLFK